MKLLAAAGFAALPVTGLAQVTWVGGAGTGNWSQASNWSPAQVPAADDTATFVNSDAASRTITYDYTGPAVTLGDLRIDQTGMGTNTLSIAAGTFTSREINVGIDGRGILKQSGGSTTATAKIVVGLNSTAAGEFDMPGGTLTTPELDIGIGSSGTIDHFGGTVTVSASLSIGAKAAAKSSYTMSKGTLTAPILTVSGAGQATYTETGGTSNFTDSIFIGTADGQGMGILSGQGVMNANKISVGGQAGSTFEGHFIMSGGPTTLTANSITVGYVPGTFGKFDVMGGTVTASLLSVGDKGDGLVEHSGGTVSLQYLYLGRVPSVLPGTYTMF